MTAWWREAERFAARMGEEGLPAPRLLAETHSTNDDAMALGRSGAPEGTVVLAAAQSGGRGRLGRNWSTVPGALAMSIVLRPTEVVGRWPLRLLGGAIDLATAWGPSWQVKWPNDIVSSDGRKVAGLLAEADVAAGVLVVGVGVNVFEAPDLPVAAALGRTDLSAVAWDVARSFVRPQPDALTRFTERMLGLGRRVTVGDWSGTVVGLADDGGLRLETDSGPRVVHAGDVALVSEVR